MEQYDEMIPCPKTGGQLCYRVQITPGVWVYQSLSSGFWTNSLMTKDSEFYNSQVESLPELYKDIEWTDPETNLVWLPLTINEQEKGMVFPMGSESSNWSWASVKSRKLSEEEKASDPLHPDYKMDMTTLVNFSPNEFVGALNYVGLLAVEEDITTN